MNTLKIAFIIASILILKDNAFAQKGCFFPPVLEDKYQSICEDCKDTQKCFWGLQDVPCLPPNAVPGLRRLLDRNQWIRRCCCCSRPFEVVKYPDNYCRDKLPSGSNYIEGL